MKKWIGILIVVFGLFYVVDIFLLRAAEERLEKMALLAAPETTAIESRIGESWLRLGAVSLVHKPVLIDLVRGRVPSVEVRMLDVTAGRLPVDELTLRSDSGKIKTSGVFKGSIDITELKGARVTLETSEAALSTLTPVPVRFEEGFIMLRTPPVETRAKATVSSDSQLIITPENGPPTMYPIADEALLPCKPRAAIHPPSLILTCEIPEKSEFLFQPAS